MLPQAQTAELRSSISSIKELVASLEAAHKAPGATASQTPRGRGAGDEDGEGGEGSGLTVSELRQELRSFAATLTE